MNPYDGLNPAMDRLWHAHAYNAVTRALGRRRFLVPPFLRVRVAAAVLADFEPRLRRYIADQIRVEALSHMYTVRKAMRWAQWVALGRPADSHPASDLEAPPQGPLDRRPYRAPHASGPEMTTYTLEGTQTWRQVGWHGGSGAFYSLDEDPKPHEPGSFSPLWVLIGNERMESPLPELEASR